MIHLDETRRISIINEFMYLVSSKLHISHGDIEISGIF
jgi:hypothetical protein